MEIKATRKALKAEAKLIKAFLVLVKRKLGRGQIPSDLNFRKLLALLCPAVFDTQANPFIKIAPGGIHAKIRLGLLLQMRFAPIMVQLFHNVAVADDGQDESELDVEVLDSNDEASDCDLFGEPEPSSAVGPPNSPSPLAHEAPAQEILSSQEGCDSTTAELERLLEDDEPGAAPLLDAKPEETKPQETEPEVMEADGVGDAKEEEEEEDAMHSSEIASGHDEKSSASSVKQHVFDEPFAEPDMAKLKELKQKLAEMQKLHTAMILEGKQSCLLIMVIVAMCNTFLVEQPNGSMLRWHPRVVQVFRSLGPGKVSDKKVKLHRAGKAPAAPALPASESDRDSDGERKKASETSGSKARVVTSLDDAIATLEKQFELAEQTKVEVSDLSTIDDATEIKRLDTISQMKHVEQDDTLYSEYFDRSPCGISRVPRPLHSARTGCVKEPWMNDLQAPCAEVVHLAKSEVAENPNASAGMRQLAAINTDDAESGCHKIFREHGLVPNVDITEVNLDSPGMKSFPTIRFRDWCQYLLDCGLLWVVLTGCSSFQKMTVVLKEFWTRMKDIMPGHGVFNLAANGTLELECTIPVYSHSDEGRSKKKAPIFILSTHGALGRGTQAYLRAGKQKAPIHRNSMGMNFIGHSMSTHMIFTCLLKAVMDKNPGCLEQLITSYSEDLKSLLLEGVTSKDLTKQVWVCHLGTKGDLPALVRVGNLQRNFYRAPKAKASKKPAVGVCHYCLAGKEQRAPDGSSNNFSPYLFEDLSANPAWLSTTFQEVPWDHTPEILNGVPLGTVPAESFFCADLWHCFHLGVAKHWVASSFITVIECLDIPDTSSVEQKFQWLNSTYQEFCQRHGRCGWVKQLDRDFFNWPSSNVCPIGSWNKGSTSTHLMKYLEWFCTKFITGKTEHEMLKAIDSRDGI
eukprot:Skav229119  [mRNA]  locus=scaffold92:800766:813847:- [translate_table: standard]